MIISERQKNKIQAEYDSWIEVQYAGKNKKERQELGQFFTPPELSIRMLERFNSIHNKTILDPTAGCGGLLAAAIIAGANPKLCYGIELDPKIANLCQERLSKFGVPKKNIKVGDALDPKIYESFEPCQIEKNNLFSFIKKENDDFYFITLFKDNDLNNPIYIKQLNYKLLLKYLQKISTKSVFIILKDHSINIDSFKIKELSFSNKDFIKLMIKSNLNRFNDILKTFSKTDFKTEKSIISLALETNQFYNCFNI